MSRYLIIACCIALVNSAFTQDLPPPVWQQLENLTEVLEDVPEEDGFLQQLAYWRRRPLNLNTADGDELRLFPFLSGLQVSQFLLYRHQLGPLIDLHELQSIPSWDLESIRQILPYVTVNASSAPLARIKDRLKGGEHLLLLRSARTVQQAKGYTGSNSSRFAGDPYQVLTRYQYRHPGGLQWGLTAEKDAGEQFGGKGNPALDFFSAHLFLRNIGWVKALALGDFTLNLGQGLVHWQSLAFGRGPAVLGIKRQSPVLRPYSSAGEARFLRGAGITLGRQRWEATFFAAAQKVDGHVEANDAGQDVITSFGISGLHRTAAERAQRKAIAQTAMGSALQYRGNAFSASVHAVYYRFSLPVQKRSEPYNLYAIRGSNHLNTGASYSYTWRNLHLFGELAANRAGKGAWVQGVLVSVHPKMDLALHGRLLGRGYHTISGDAFGESTHPANEQGWYAGMHLRLHPVFTISTYADVFRFPWLRYRVDAPAAGADYLLQAAYQPNKKSSLYIRFRWEEKWINAVTGTAVFRQPSPWVRSNLRLHLSQVLGQHWQVRSRAEILWFTNRDKLRETGFLWFGEIKFEGFSQLDIQSRITYFETGSYHSRLYAYEPDVPFSFAIPALFGKGVRGNLTVNYKFAARLSLAGRMAHTVYPNQEVIGTGNTQIKGNERTDVRLQVLWRLRD